MSAPVRAVRAMIRANDTLTTLVGNRVYPDAGVPQRARRPLIRLKLVGIDRDVDLDGNVDSRSATVNLQICGDTEAQVAEVLAVLEGDGGDDGELNNLSGTFAGVEVADTGIVDDSISDVSDEPLDLDIGQAFIAEADLEILYA